MDQSTAAATVILLRETAAGLELLLTQRSRRLGFAGGAMVFPGGKVDVGDLAVARDPISASGFGGLSDADAAARIAASRETLEEVGVLLSDGPPLDATTLADWRGRFIAVPDEAEAATYAAFLAATGHRADAARLLPFSHWVPPVSAGLSRRFDTLFYVARVDADTAVEPDGVEAVAAHWTTPAAALVAADAGEIGLVFPTRRNIERLAQYATIAALTERLAELPLVRIQPEVVVRDGVDWLTIPAGCDYPITEERFDTVRRE
ncbi:NUDIX hydrolase [Glacieibacterium sp.]|uniref:NUDIX hydrolase n=1 Tax=Glacieibacterium sp. TaxID=2860237 RepID=UPI003B00A9F0